MEIKDIPLRFMRTEVSCPRQEAWDFLEEHCIPDYIARRYQSPEDRADAFDGAFTGFHIHAHLSKGGDKETWLIEILGWYDWMDQKNLRGPFFDGLRATLESCGLGNFYREALDYIQRQEGRLD